MKLKSLLIGSAAVVAAASGAQAADAVVMAPAPEPMEYVRVCDVYGAGFFYIPGTETCLKISGYIFYEVGATSQDTGDTSNHYGFAQDEYNKYLRARVNFDARSETEWGTLRSYIRFQANNVNGPITGDAGVAIDQAWLSLGGLRMGYSESAFTSTVNGGPSGGGTHSWYALDNYGYSQRQFIQYNFSGGGGFFGTISLENDPSPEIETTALVDTDGDGLVDTATTTTTTGGDPNYIPDVVAKIGVTQGWGTAWATVGVDEYSLVTTDTEWAAQAGVDLSIPGMVGDSLRIIGFYASDPNDYWDDGEWSILGSYKHQFNPEFWASVGAQYIANTDFGASGDDPNEWLAELNLVWTPVTDFEIRSEISYQKATDLDGTVSGMVRFTRYFGG